MFRSHDSSASDKNPPTNANAKEDLDEVGSCLGMFNRMVGVADTPEMWEREGRIAYYKIPVVSCCGAGEVVAAGLKESFPIPTYCVLVN
mmetsp:Transcript_27491/g.42385  ORF Transcript_27491/g.42385 Transcript_27491/m.42385 type:complete len:89 (-) Transcript_27491:39-305(-)